MGLSQSPADKVLFESPSLVAMPSIGSLVPGWMLVITKEHFLCMAELPDDQLTELQTLTSEVEAAVSQRFGECVIFEHGPGKPGESVGCGVDHAHLHVVPTTFDLARGATELAEKTLIWQHVAGLEPARAPHQSGMPYLYLRQRHLHWLATADSIESQLFRKVIAHRVGKSELWNWRDHPEPHIAANTIEALSRWQRPNDPSGRLTTSSR